MSANYSFYALMCGYMPRPEGVQKRKIERSSFFCAHSPNFVISCQKQAISLQSEADLATFTTHNLTRRWDFSIYFSATAAAIRPRRKMGIAASLTPTDSAIAGVATGSIGRMSQPARWRPTASSIPITTRTASGKKTRGRRQSPPH